MPLHRLLALLFLSLATASAQEWIWHSQNSADGEVRYFRKTFTLTAAPAEATLSVACDNRAKVFVNGVEVGASEDWKAPLKARVEKQLKAGENTIAIRGKNDDGVAALVARLEIKGGPAIASDTTWLSSDKEVPGWEKPGFTAAGWAKPIARGKLGGEPWGDVFSGRAAGGKGKAPTTELTTPAGFKAELLLTAQPGEGSWVSMAVDPKGRIIVCSQSKPTPAWGGLMRFTLGADGKVAKTEKLETPIGSAMGLLWAHDALYVDGSGPQGYGLYRLKFENDQPAGAAEFLFKGADGEHGSHGVVLGPDGALYLMAGNHTKLPTGLAPTGALKGWAEDHLLPRQWDANGHAVGIVAPGGWCVRSHDQGKTWETFCGSFRNAYDLAFNADGELFTFDSDMEWDIGSPWYRPTRVNHCVSGGEYGWRSGSSNQPAYYYDSLPAVVDIGIGSPTGVKFGTGAKGWPVKYQRAFYAMDWANGKLFAVHLTPQGASFAGTSEVFVEGKPLNITNLEFVNGDMYFTTGGRGTQAALYRVRYDGPPTSAPVGPTVDAAAIKLRRSLEAFHGRADAKAVETAWPHLDSPDRFIRWAARTAIEFQPVATWQQRALGEKRPWAALEAMLALTRCAKPDVKAHLCEGITTLTLEQMSEEQQLAAIRLTGLVFTRLGAPTEDERRKLSDLWMRFFPAKTERLNRELAILCVFLDAPGTVEKTMSLMRAATTQELQIHYAFQLRNGLQYASPGEKKPAGPLTGWTPTLRREYLAWFLKASREYKGGASFAKFLANIKKDALDTFTPEEKIAAADLLHPAAVPPATAASAGHPRGFVQSWTLDQLLAAVGTAKGDAAKGRKIYAEAQCVLCHRYGQEGGAVGPDLTGVASRFSRRDLLEATVDPGKIVSDQYRYSVITTTKGKEIMGRQIDDTPTKIALAENPFTSDRTEIAKADIKSRELSPISPMPPALLNLFSKEEIIDLLTYLETGK